MLQIEEEDLGSDAAREENEMWRKIACFLGAYLEVLCTRLLLCNHNNSKNNLEQWFKS